MPKGAAFEPVQKLIWRIAEKTDMDRDYHADRLKSRINQQEAENVMLQVVISIKTIAQQMSFECQSGSCP